MTDTNPDPAGSGAVMISVAPEDPAQKKEWAHAMMRLQIAMWLPCSCAHCGKPFESVDDFLERNPRCGSNDDPYCFVDDACFEKWEATP